MILDDVVLLLPSLQLLNVKQYFFVGFIYFNFLLSCMLSLSSYLLFVLWSALKFRYLLFPTFLI